MKKCCFVVPYFGKLPNYMQLFLNCCKYNDDFDWMIFTDDRTPFEIPSNVHMVYTSFDDIRKEIEQKFNFELKLLNPYKFCDFKPAYGYIFEEKLSEYKFWGHCDLDIIMGDLSSFITEEMLSCYDKLFVLGHMILYRNTYENNRMFMSSVNGEYWYKQSFTSYKITIFDEPYKNKTNVNEIFRNYNKKIFEEDLSYCIKVLPTKFVRTKYDAKNDVFIDDNRVSVYVWDKGKLYRVLKDKDKLIYEEAMYIHLQERLMKLELQSNTKSFQIVPNSFLPISGLPSTVDDWEEIPKETLNFHYIQYHTKWKIHALKRVLNRILGQEEKNYR